MVSTSADGRSRSAPVETGGTMSLNITNLFSVQGKKALVTGGATGIGRMIARGLVENGADVYIASRKLDACIETANALSDVGPGTCTPLQLDVADVSSFAGF